MNPWERSLASMRLQRAPRPLAASAVFFAIAVVYSRSGKGGDWVLASSALNMVSVIAKAWAAGTHGSAT